MCSFWVYSPCSKPGSVTVDYVTADCFQLWKHLGLGRLSCPFGRLSRFSSSRLSNLLQLEGKGQQMKKVSRSKMELYGDLLTVLNDETNSEKVVLTRIQGRVNVPFDRFKNYISELNRLGLIQDETSLKLTEKGKQYLKEYEQILDFMKRMGLTDREQ
jgi:predicted transcriptional regulator